MGQIPLDHTSLSSSIQVHHCQLLHGVQQHSKVPEEDLTASSVKTDSDISDRMNYFYVLLVIGQFDLFSTNLCTLKSAIQFWAHSQVKHLFWRKTAGSELYESLARYSLPR